MKLLFTQVHLLFDSLAEDQYATIVDIYIKTIVDIYIYKNIE